MIKGQGIAWFDHTEQPEESHLEDDDVQNGADSFHRCHDLERSIAFLVVQKYLRIIMDW